MEGELCTYSRKATEHTYELYVHSLLVKVAVVLVYLPIGWVSHMEKEVKRSKKRESWETDCRVWKKISQCMCYISVTHINSISVSDYHVTFLSTNSILRHMTVGYHIISVPLFTQTFLQDSLSSSQVIPYVNTIQTSSADINSDSLLFISTLNFVFQGMGMHRTIFIIYHMLIPCLTIYL